LWHSNVFRHARTASTLPPKPNFQTVSRSSLCTVINFQSRQDGDGSSTELITGVYLEASNASSYIRNGFRLLLPVLQLALIRAHPLFKDADS
jgi:hypothetical protein